MKPWTPEVRAGQHVMVGFEGTHPPAALLARARAGEVGGVILFRRNVESAAQTAALLASLQKAARTSPTGLPLLVGIDQEGGRVNRLSADFTTFPAARDFGEADDSALVKEAARITGAELRAVGVNINFAPVLDVLSNPRCAVIGDRSFGASANLVAHMGEALTEGLQEAGVAACAKHFPGIGDMAPDPHDALPVCSLSLADLKTRELPPFQRLLGRCPPACVMAAHAVYAKIDETTPASLSPRFIGELLRGLLGFAGVCITDDLDMGAIEDPPAAALEAIRAGGDVALICHAEDAQTRAFETIARAIREGAISEEAEAASAERIRRLKEAFCRPLAGGAKENLKTIRCAAHQRAHARILSRISAARGCAHS